MAYTQTHSDFHTTRPGFLTRARTAVVQWFEVYSRAGRIAALTAISDTELAAKGLRREDIVRHVFRDRANF